MILFAIGGNFMIDRTFYGIRIIEMLEPDPGSNVKLDRDIRILLVNKELHNYFTDPLGILCI
jgi:hypothetical protein